MEGLNQTWEKVDGQMVLVSEEIVEVPAEIVEPNLSDLQGLMLLLEERIEALEGRTTINI